jgi:hypothetical protein
MDSRILVGFVGVARLVAGPQPVGGSPVGPQNVKQDSYKCCLLYYAFSAVIQGLAACVVCGKEVRGKEPWASLMTPACLGTEVRQVAKDLLLPESQTIAGVGNPNWGRYRSVTS